MVIVETPSQCLPSPPPSLHSERLPEWLSPLTELVRSLEQNTISCGQKRSHLFGQTPGPLITGQFPCCPTCGFRTPPTQEHPHPHLDSLQHRCGLLRSKCWVLVGSRNQGVVGPSTPASSESHSPPSRTLLSETTGRNCFVAGGQTLLSPQALVLFLLHSLGSP